MPVFSSHPTFPAPPLKRRLAVMLYEAMLLFGVVFITSWLFDTLTQSRHALMLRDARQILLLLVLGAYFSFFWRRSGQTLAMKTWHVRLISANGQSLSWRQTIVRYMLCWMWFMPAMALDTLLGFKGWPSILMILLGMFAWAATIWTNVERQFLHDLLAGTRLVSALPAQRAAETQT